MELTIRPVVKISPYSKSKNAADEMLTVFCTFIGSDVLKLLCSLCSTKKPEECAYDDLKTKIDSI